jgi:hypothetical protein
MSRLEHCLENAIAAIEQGKDYDAWRYEEIPRLNASYFNRDWAVLTDNSIIFLSDIWAMAVYVVYTHDTNKANNNSEDVNDADKSK